MQAYTVLLKGIALWYPSVFNNGLIPSLCRCTAVSSYTTGTAVTSGTSYTTGTAITSCTSGSAITAITSGTNGSAITSYTADTAITSNSGTTCTAITSDTSGNTIWYTVQRGREEHLMLSREFDNKIPRQRNNCRRNSEHDDEGHEVFEYIRWGSVCHTTY